VWVSIGPESVLAGRLYAHRRRGIESATFSYDETYLARPDAYALDPALPLLSGLQQSPASHKMFGAFADSSPDRWGRNLIRRAETRRAADDAASPRTFGEFDLLLRVRDDLRRGAIRYRAHQQFQATVATGVPTMTDLPTLMSAVAAVVSENDDEQSLALLLRAGSSLGGAPQGTRHGRQRSHRDREVWF
jgi:serine/threonine-protein kinase HipA